MKRGRHDSDYDCIRHQAGYTKPLFDFPDEREERETAERIMQKNEEFKARMKELDQLDRQKEFEAQQRHAERRREIDRRMILQEYERLGLHPPEGEVLVSLHLLKRIGWRIEDVDGKATLIKPAPMSARRKTREDYEAERAGTEGS